MSRVDGVEQTLRRGHAFQKVGWGAFVVSAVSAVGSVFTSAWFNELVGAGWAAQGWHSWFLAIGIASVVVAIVLVGWLRFWVRASRTPFHYTYSIENFNPVEGTPPQEQLAWLPHDLSKRLSERIGRLSLLDERYSGETDAPDAHIHLGGAYGMRTRGDSERVVEVMPWVRLGPTGSPAKLAHAVSFRSDRDLDTTSYEKLVERVYFSIATRIYRQIRDDVQRKINLLPRRYFRAAAYFYEAEDYIRSNTLDAYEQAHKLYAAAVSLYAPIWGEPASGQSAGLIARLIDRLLARWSLFWRRRLAWLWPGLCRIEVMVARAEVGYARTLVYRRTVAGLSGQRLNPVFSARPIAERAVSRLTRLRKDVPGRRKRLFDAYVTKAAVLAELGSYNDAGKCLDEARAIDPTRSEQNAFYMYGQGQVETRQRGYFFQRAGELLPSFEVAQFARAIQTELLWRRRPMREANVAEIVAADYERVLELNPGNVSAWANLGYMYWLLGDAEQAGHALLRGREYKEIRHETFVAELDYTLARVAAETGDFARAYSHYVDAVTGRVAQGVAPAEGYTGYQFLGMPRWMLDRFRQYELCVKRHWLEARDLPDPAPDGTTQRVRRAVYAFVMNDYGEACLNYWLRSGERRYFRIARHAFEEALHGQLSSAQGPRRGLGEVRPQTRNPVVSFNLNRLRRWEVEWIDTSQWYVDRSDHEDSALRAADKLLEFRPRDTHIDRALTYEPRWTEGLLEKAWSDMVLARQSRAVAAVLSQFATRRRESARNLEVAERQVPSVETPIDPRERELKLKLTGSAAAAATTLPASRTEQKREESKALSDRAQELEEKADNLRSAAKAFDNEACSAPERLLPHEWLRRGDAFDWGAAKRRALKRRRMWERELDVPQVWAIFALCQAEVTRLEGEQTRAARKSLGNAWSMLALLRERFWPDSIDLLNAAEHFPGRKAEEDGDLQARKRRIVTRWCELDPSFMAFQNLLLVEPEFRRDRIDAALEAVEAGLRTDLEQGLRSSLRRRFPMRRPWLATADVHDLVETLSEDRGVAPFIGETIEQLGAALDAADADPSRREGLAKLIVDLVPPAESDLRAAAYDEIRKAIAGRESKGEEAATALVEIADLRGGLRRAPQDPRSLYQRIGTALRRHGTSQGVAAAAAQAEISEFISKSVELLRTMYGDRGVPPSLYAQIGDALYARGDKQGALEAYARRPDPRRPLSLSAVGRTAAATATREQRGAPEDPAILRGIGRVHWSNGRYEAAFDQLRAIRRRADDLESGWRSELAGDLLAEQSGETGDAASGYRLFKNWLGRELTTAHGRALRRGGDERSIEEVADAASAVLRVTRERYMDLIHRRGEGQVTQAARPLAQAVLEAHTDFFISAGKVLPIVEELIYTNIPQCRSETERDVGLVLPPVLIKVSSEIDPKSYRLHVEGVPADGKTFASSERRFLPAGVQQSDGPVQGKSGWNPRGGTGLWTDGSGSNGQQGWDRYGYMVEHLRAILLTRPEGLPLASSAVDHYEDGARRSADQPARVRLVAVLRALLRERVTTFDLRAVVEAFIAADRRPEIRDVVEDVRLAVRDALPGADGSLRLFTLPPELEDQISGLVRVNSSSRFLAASRAEATALLSNLDRVLDGIGSDAALVVLRPRLRPFVRTFVAYRHPALPVLAYAELPLGSMALVQPETIA